MCARDPNAGARARAKEVDRQKQHTFASRKVGYFNKELTWDKNRKFITGTGLSRDYSDIAANLDAARGKTLAASEDLARKFYASQVVDEGGRARSYGRSAKMVNYLSKQSQLDSQLAKMYGVGRATAYTGVRRKTSSMLAKNRANLGLPPQFGPATMMPPKGDTTMANLGIGLTLASIAFPFMAPASMMAGGALTATGTAVASGLAAGGSMLYSSGMQPTYY